MRIKKKINKNTSYNNKCLGCNVCCRDDNFIPISPVDLYRLTKFTELSGKETLETYCSIAIHKRTGLPIAILKKKVGGQCVFKSGVLCLLGENKPETCLLHPLKKIHSELEEPQYMYKNIDCEIANRKIDTISTVERTLQNKEGIDIAELTYNWGKQLHLLAYEVIGDYKNLQKTLHPSFRDDVQYKLAQTLYDIGRTSNLSKQMNNNYKKARKLLHNVRKMSSNNLTNKKTLPIGKWK